MLRLSARRVAFSVAVTIDRAPREKSSAMSRPSRRTVSETARIVVLRSPAVLVRVLTAWEICWAQPGGVSGANSTVNSVRRPLEVLASLCQVFKTMFLWPEDCFCGHRGKGASTKAAGSKRVQAGKLNISYAFNPMAGGVAYSKREGLPDHGLGH